MYDSPVSEWYNGAGHIKSESALAIMEIENVPIQILYGELPQSPWLGFQRIHDVRACRLQFLVRSIDIFSEHPVNGRLERLLPPSKENCHTVA
jgi:hypothetical protein